MKAFLVKRKVSLILSGLIVFLTVVLTALLPNQNTASALENGLALTPPMGWNCWNCFGMNINETLIREIADVMVSSGMKDAGYEYIIMDDGWQVSRDSNGIIAPDPVKFPNGIKAVADYVHAKGLKLGLYSDRGTATCCGKPGSLGYEEQDARTYAQWGIDYLKYDNCNANGATMQVDYERMRDALAQCGRPIVYSICAWWFNDWMPGCGNLWRTTTDITDKWSSVCNLIDINQQWAKQAGPGHWNDPDMLEVGNSGMTDTEYRAHFSMWCIMAAPLMTGNDLRKMSPATLEILTNPEVIAVDQDPAGIQGVRVVDNGDLEVWCKPLGSANGSAKAVALFNRSGSTSTMTVNWDDIGITGSASVRDLWDQVDRGNYNGSYSATVPSHGVVLLKIVQTSATTPTSTPIVSQIWIPYVPNAAQVSLTDEPQNSLMQVDLNFPDGGYRVAAEGEIAVAAGINPDGTTYLSNLTDGVKIEKYTGNSPAVITTKRITYQIHYGDTTYFAFQVSGVKVKDITIKRTPSSPTPTLPTPTPSLTPTPTPTVTAGSGCTVSYEVQNDWGGGATVNITIKNNGTTVMNGWTLAWTFPGNQTISNLWNGVLTQSGAAVTVKSASYNAVIAPNGGTVNFGFNLNYNGKNAKPGEFTLNGTACPLQ